MRKATTPGFEQIVTFRNQVPSLMTYSTRTSRSLRASEDRCLAAAAPARPAAARPGSVPRILPPVRQIPQVSGRHPRQ